MAHPQTDPSDASALGTAAAAILRQLIRFDTVNPPGNEQDAQEWIGAQLQEAGFHVQLLSAEEGRPNLIADLGPTDDHRPGRDVDGPVVTLLSHVDTVLADASDWTRDPWSGDLVDGWIWGRGAIDMKSQTAAEMAAAIGLARSGWRPSGGVLRLIVAADEEAGGTVGARWLCEQHPALVRSDVVLNEGGGSQLVVGDRRVYGLGVGEKGVCRFRLRTRGRAAHASTPRVGDNALARMLTVVQRIHDAELPIDLTDAPRQLLGGLGVLEPGGDPSRAVEILRERAPALAPIVEPMLRVTVAPTMISASSKVNVIPASSELTVDCRIPPGMDRATAERRIAALVDGLDAEVEVFEVVEGNASPTDGPVVDAIFRWLAKHDSTAAGVVPTIMPGFTDSRWFREAFPECRAYGFFPHRHMPLTQVYPLMHAADERIEVRDLAYATRAYADLARELLG